MDDTTYWYDDDRSAEMTDDATAADCPCCSGPLRTTGTLGSRLWSRCRQCGLECSRPAVAFSAVSSDDSEDCPF